jgi:hypothetical protein
MRESFRKNTLNVSGRTITAIEKWTQSATKSTLDIRPDRCQSGSASIEAWFASGPTGPRLPWAHPVVHCIHGGPAECVRAPFPGESSYDDDGYAIYPVRAFNREIRDGQISFPRFRVRIFQGVCHYLPRKHSSTFAFTREWKTSGSSTSSTRRPMTSSRFISR